MPIGGLVLAGVVTLVLILLFFVNITLDMIISVKNFVNTAQAMWLAVTASIQWPAFVLRIKEVLQSINVDVTVVSPVCYVNGLNWDSKYWLLVGVVGGLLAALFVVERFVTRRLRLLRKDLDTHRECDVDVHPAWIRRQFKLRALLLELTALAYLLLTITAVDSLLCQRVGPQLLLIGDTSIQCDQPAHVVVMVVSVLILLVLTVGLPVFIAAKVRSLQHWRTGEDHTVNLLRFDPKEDEETRTARYEAKRTWGVLWLAYGPDNAPWFEAVQLMRKSTVAVVVRAAVAVSWLGPSITLLVAVVYLALVHGLQPLLVRTLRLSGDRRVRNLYNRVDQASALAVAVAAVAALLEPVQLNSTIVTVVLGGVAVGVIGLWLAGQVLLLVLKIREHRARQQGGCCGVACVCCNDVSNEDRYNALKRMVKEALKEGDVEAALSIASEMQDVWMELQFELMMRRKQATYSGQMDELEVVEEKLKRYNLEQAAVSVEEADNVLQRWEALKHAVERFQLETKELTEETVRAATELNDRRQQILQQMNDLIPRCAMSAQTKLLQQLNDTVQEVRKEQSKGKRTMGTTTARLVELAGQCDKALRSACRLIQTKWYWSDTGVERAEQALAAVYRASLDLRRGLIRSLAGVDSQLLHRGVSLLPSSGRIGVGIWSGNCAAPWSYRLQQLQ